MWKVMCTLPGTRKGGDVRLSFPVHADTMNWQQPNLEDSDDDNARGNCGMEEGGKNLGLLMSSWTKLGWHNGTPL